MKLKHRMPRCIAFVDGWRCRHRAVKSNGDVFICTRHSMWTALLIEDGSGAATRRMLAFSRWETKREGQMLIDRMHRRVAA